MRSYRDRLIEFEGKEGRWRIINNKRRWKSWKRAGSISNSLALASDFLIRDFGGPLDPSGTGSPARKRKGRSFWLRAFIYSPRV